MQKIRNSFDKLHLWATTILTPQFSLHGLTAHIHLEDHSCSKAYAASILVHNGTISFTYWGFLNDYYMINPIGQWEKILVTFIGLNMLKALGHALRKQVLGGLSPHPLSLEKKAFT